MRARGVTAVLGPTNTGKTHLAIERLLGHGAGIIGLPLRLLAREVYKKIVDRVGPEFVALVTGEEKIKPEKARYWVATAEAMPRDLDVVVLGAGGAARAAALGLAKHGAARIRSDRPAAWRCTWPSIRQTRLLPPPDHRVHPAPADYRR